MTVHKRFDRITCMKHKLVAISLVVVLYALVSIPLAMGLRQERINDTIPIDSIVMYGHEWDHSKFCKACESK